MSNEKIPATEESRKALYDKMGEIVWVFSPILRKWILIQRELELNNDKHKTYRALLSLCIFSCYFTIEMASVLRSSFRATLLTEKRYNIKYVNCVINEAYKYLYDFDNPNKQTQHRSKLWKSLIRIDNKELKSDLSSLEELITKLAKDGVADRDCRNLSFHYDENPVSVYNMLIRLGEEEECQRMIRFMEVLDEIAKFVHKWMREYQVNVEVEPDYLFTLSEIDLFKKNKDKLFEAMGSAIETHSKGLDVAVRRYDLPDRLAQYFGDAPKESFDVVNKIVALEQAAMQVQFILIDIASASRAYLTAEHTIERQLSLKQITIILYEGFNKIYGFDDAGKQKSFWTRLIAPIVAECSDEQLHIEFDAISREMNGLKSKIKTLERQRHLFVHYDRDQGLVSVCDELHKLNPLVQFMSAHDIIKFLPKVLNFFTSCLRVIDRNRQDTFQKKMAPTHEAIDNALSLLERQPDSPQKEQLVTLLTKFKTGEFVDDLIKRAKGNHHLI
jgi:hypothetical protein